MELATILPYLVQALGGAVGGNILGALTRGGGGLVGGKLIGAIGGVGLGFAAGGGVLGLVGLLLTRPRD